MKKIFSIMVMVLATAMSVMSCAKADANKADIANEDNVTKGMETNIKDKRTLVVFFSHTGENYSVGNITEGNTHIIAGMIGEATGGELFEIEPEKEYPHDSYNAVVEIAKREKAEKARPAIKGDVAVEDYDVIFIGYPNWWGDMPMPVYVFIEKHGWEGKTVIPFCTHEGSGLSDTEKYIAEACKGATVVKGLAVEGSTAQNDRDKAREIVNVWLD